MDGFTYELTAGGWHVCDVCGARATSPEKHGAWHLELTAAIVRASTPFGSIGGFEWNAPQKEAARD